MAGKKRFISILLIMVVGTAGISSLAQQASKPLTNADVVKMVKSGLPESLVITSIKSRPGKFDVSPEALIALHQGNVTPGEMDAMMAVAKGAAAGNASSPAVPATNGNANASAAPSPPLASPTKSRMPKVVLIRGGSAQELPLEKTQLAQTKTKPTSMTSLSGDSAAIQGMQVGIGTATEAMASHMNSGIGSGSLEQAGGILSGMMAHREPTVTYVWGVPNPASSNVVQTASPQFSVNFSETPGVNPDEFQPSIIKLTPAQNTCRIVGASQGKEGARSSSTVDWQIYSHFLEDQVPIRSKKLGSGQYEFSPASALLPGDYAVVLRPVSKSKKFSGGDVARGQGDGLMFDSVWSFQIPADAQ